MLSKLNQAIKSKVEKEVENMTVHVHVDDFIFFVNPSNLNEAGGTTWFREKLENIMAKYEQELSLEKCILEPVCKVKYCGILIDLDNKTLSISADKVERMVRIIAYMCQIDLGK